MFFSFLKYLNGGIYMCFVDVCICALSMSVTLWTSLGVGSCPCTMTFWCCSIVLTCSYIFACFISSTLFPEPSFLSSIWSVLLVRISTEFLDMLRFSKIPIFYVCFPHFHACVCVVYAYVYTCLHCVQVSMHMCEHVGIIPNYFGHFHWGIVSPRPSSHLRESG